MSHSPSVIVSVFVRVDLEFDLLELELFLNILCCCTDFTIIFVYFSGFQEAEFSNANSTRFNEIP